MKKFLTLVFCFGLILLISFYAIFCMADGSTDAMYLKFTTPKKESLVLGGSRASQGIQPSQMTSILNHDDLYNYAFQNPSSPYGDVYLNSIKRKVKDSGHNGLFILEVNPWNMIVNDSVVNGNSYLTETDNFIANTTDVTSNPNLEYLMNSFDKRVITILQNKTRKGDNETYLIEADGWLNVSIQPDSLINYYRRKQKVKIYTDKLKRQNYFSDYRQESLIRTIKFLKHYGDVYLVRLPISSEMLTLEDQLLPDFNEKIKFISDQCNVIYINKMPSNKLYSYVDGHHLDGESGRKFSIDLANSIKEYIKINPSDN